MQVELRLHKVDGVQVYNSTLAFCQNKPYFAQIKPLGMDRQGGRLTAPTSVPYLSRYRFHLFQPDIVFCSVTPCTKNANTDSRTMFIIIMFRRSLRLLSGVIYTYIYIFSSIHLPAALVMRSCRPTPILFLNSLSETFSCKRNTENISRQV